MAEEFEWEPKLEKLRRQHYVSPRAIRGVAGGMHVALGGLEARILAALTPLATFRAGLAHRTLALMPVAALAVAALAVAALAVAALAAPLFFRCFVHRVERVAT